MPVSGQLQGLSDQLPLILNLAGEASEGLGDGLSPASRLSSLVFLPSLAHRPGVKDPR